MVNSKSSKSEAVNTAEPVELEQIVSSADQVSEAEQSDPLDLAKLRYDPSTMENTGVKKLLTTVPVRKPKAQTYFRVHPDENYRFNVALLELEEDGDSYLVLPPVLAALPEHLAALVKENTLYTCMTRQSTLFMWPIKAVPARGRADFAISAREGASHAMEKWTRIAWKRDLGAYVIFP